MHSSENPPESDGGVDTPYLAARREWNERYGDYIARARNWRWAGIRGPCRVRRAFRRVRCGRFPEQSRAVRRGG